jgi:hypothetical protein
VIVKNLHEEQHESKKPSLSRNLSEEEATYKLFSFAVGGALEEAVLAATRRSTSRSPTPRGVGSRSVTGTHARLWSRPRGACRLSSRRGAAAAFEAGRLPRRGTVLTVDYHIIVHMDLQADESPVVVKGSFFPRVVNPRYRIRGTMCNVRIQSSKAWKAIF